MRQDIFEEFGLHCEEIEQFKEKSDEENFGDKAILSRTKTLAKKDGLSAYIAKNLWECKRLLSKTGYSTGLMSMKQKPEMGQDWEELLKCVYSSPLVFKNRVVWLLFQAFLQAQRDFALDACRSHSHEVLLTGRLTGEISGACKEWNKAARSYLQRSGNRLEISSLDLSVGGGEQVTGADLALILEIDEVDIKPCDLEENFIRLTGSPIGNIIIPIIFQAKCYKGSSADISQRHDVRGYQYNTLRRNKCASNYIFYENDRHEIKYPALPMVKPVSACKPIEISNRTDVFEGSLDLATYILRAVNGFADIKKADSREEALNMILANASPHSLGRVAIIGNGEGLKLKYRAALENLRNEIRMSPGEQQSSDFNPPTL